ncbi:hypothetical protein PS838_02808 [Pseudomonas fluorescens]|nr:hypothetical protein PS838_02808 [Pseudomonas fluorescens]
MTVAWLASLADSLEPDHKSTFTSPYGKLTEIFGVSALHISEKGDRIISEGAAWIAHDNLQLALAKPFELVEARNSLLTIVHEGINLKRQQTLGQFIH